MANTYITFDENLVHFQKAAEEVSYKDKKEAKENSEINRSWEAMIKAWRALKDGTLQNVDSKYLTNECRKISGEFKFKGAPYSLTIFQDTPAIGANKVRAVQITNSEETISSYFKDPSTTSQWTLSTNVYLKI